MWGMKRMEQDTGRCGCLHRVPWEGTQMSLNMPRIRAVLSVATAAKRVFYVETRSLSCAVF